MNQTEIIGVRFKPVGKIYYFDPCGKKTQYQQGAILETIRGTEYGTVVIPNKMEVVDKSILPLKPLIRLATDYDTKKYLQNLEEAKKAIEVCEEKIKNHNLEMKIIDAEYTFDKGKLLFYFTADGRIDFRELVKDLAAIFRTRIELRQIGVRDEAKAISGISMCGRPLCCATFLGDFHPVSIKMAKDQNLSLNPVKISGSCGRLMCCLQYEDEVYQEINKTLPNIGDTVTTPDGKGQIMSINTLRQILKIALKDKNNETTDIKFYSITEVEVKKNNKKSTQNEQDEIE
ncbi:MAG: stage 0 sporulation family protein [Lachnospirales bacterium]